MVSDRDDLWFSAGQLLPYWRSCRSHRSQMWSFGVHLEMPIASLAGQRCTQLGSGVWFQQFHGGLGNPWPGEIFPCFMGLIDPNRRIFWLRRLWGGASTMFNNVQQCSTANHFWFVNLGTSCRQIGSGESWEAPKTLELVDCVIKPGNAKSCKITMFIHFQASFMGNHLTSTY